MKSTASELGLSVLQMLMMYVFCYLEYRLQQLVQRLF